MSETVWDKEGKPHKMSPANARDLVRFAGWTTVPPMIIEAVEATKEAMQAAEDAAEQLATAKALEEAQKAAEEKAATLAASAKVAAEEAQKAAREAEEKSEAAEESNDPKKMTVEKLTSLAEGLGIEVDNRWGKTRLLQEIQKASKS